MHPKFLGDSYDLVKRSLLACLRELGPWHVHPMFATRYDDDLIQRYQHLLGVELITTDPIPARPWRQDHIALAHQFGNVLFDPDTGLKCAGFGRAARRFLCLDELLDAAHARPAAITCVFDQSLSHGQSRPELQAKANKLHELGLPSFAYYSHACFVFASVNTTRLEAAHDLLIQAGLPECRLLRGRA